MPEFDISYDPSNKEEQILKALHDGIEYGVLSFGPKEENPNIFQINLLKSTVERQGVARKLIKKMVEIVGPGVRISSVITNVETQEAIQDLGYYEQARMNGTVEITDRAIIDKLPIVKVRTSGGIFTNRIKVVFDHNEPEIPFYIVADGITDPQGTYRTAALKECGLGS